MTTRSPQTRLLEACYLTTIECFGQEHLAPRYSANGNARIYAFPLSLGDGSIVPCQINITPVPTQIDVGVGGLSETDRQIEFAFYFPVNLMRLTVGERTFLDDVEDLSDWLRAGGGWREDGVTPRHKGGRLPDPDNAGQYLGALRSIAWSEPFFKLDAKGGVVATVVPLTATFAGSEVRK